jgi:hypothetical protein
MRSADGTRPSSALHKVVFTGLRMHYCPAVDDVLLWNRANVGNLIHAGQGPDFPLVLPGWRLRKEWDDHLRAFRNEWRSLRPNDPDNPYPATMNGCGNQRFLIRWRSISGVPVRFGCGTVAGDIGTIVEDELPVPAERGWAELHGCGWPLWQYIEQDGGGHLGDIAVALQQWTAAA